MSLRRRRDPQYLELTTNKNGTFVTSITRIAGAPACVWKFEDGEEQTGDSCSKAMDGHEQKVVLKIAPKYILNLDCNSSMVSTIHNLKKCAHLDALFIYGNLYLLLHILEIPDDIQHIWAWNCQSLYGNITDLDSSIVTASFPSCIGIEGSIDELSARDIITMSFDGCPHITGSLCSLFLLSHEIYLSNQSATQARVNAIIDDIYDHKDAFTFATPTLNIDGNNAAPDAEHILLVEELVADYSWVISYTLPS